MYRSPHQAKEKTLLHGKREGGLSNGAASYNHAVQNTHILPQIVVLCPALILRTVITLALYAVDCVIVVMQVEARGWIRDNSNCVMQPGGPSLTPPTQSPTSCILSELAGDTQDRKQSIFNILDLHRVSYSVLAQLRI